MAVIASQLAANISIQGAPQAQATFSSMSSGSKKAQADLSQLQSVAQDVANVVQNKFAQALRSSQGPLQSLAQQAADAGLDTTKLADLQAKAAVAADNLAVAQDRAAAALQKAANITIDAASSEADITAAQDKASLAADKVAVAQNSAAAAMSKLQAEAGNLSTTMAESEAKTTAFSTATTEAEAGTGGFLSGIKGAAGGLLDFGMKASMTLMGVQMLGGMFMNVAKAAGDMVGGFQQQLTKLTTTAGESTDKIKMVGDGILAMAGPTATSVKDLGAAMYFVEGGGAHGKKALEDLRIAAMGAKTENADLTGVTKALMFTLANYSDTGLTAAGAMNTLITATGESNMTLQDMSGAISNVMPTAHAFGISLADVTGGLATMVMKGDDASAAATHLAMMIKTLEAPSSAGAKAIASIGLTTQQVTDEMRVSLPGALDLIITKLKDKFPEGSTAYNEALKNISGGSKSMQAILETTGSSLDLFKQNVDKITGAVKAGGDSIAGWSDVTQNFNFMVGQATAAAGAFGVKIGTALAPMFSQMIGAITGQVIPALSNFGNWIVISGIPAIQHFADSIGVIISPLQQGIGWLNNFVGHGQAAIPIIAGIGGAITAVLLPALIEFLSVAIPGMATLAVETIAATWPFLAVAVAVGGLTAAFLHFYNSNAGFKTFVDGAVASLEGFWNTLTSNVMPVLKQVGDFIASTFTPVWQELQQVWQSQMQPALQGLWQSLQPLMPILTTLAEVIGGILLGAVVLIIGEFGAMIGALGGLMRGVAEMIGGVVQIVSGFIQTIVGIVTFLVDLFTGHFDKLGGDLKTILGGIGEIFSGFGTVLKGIVDGIVGSVVGGFKGMATTVIGTLNDLVNGVDNSTQKASIAAQLNTAQMKDKSIANAQAMSEQTQMKLIDMRNGIEKQLSETTDATQKHTLEMKLAAVNNSLEAAQSVGKNIVDMRERSLEQVDLLKQGVDVKLMSTADLAKYHALNMKDQYLGGVIQMDNDSVKKVDEMRQGILDELSRTTDGAKKQSLETQLTQVTNAENTAKKVKDIHVQQKADTESQMDDLRKSIATKSAGIMGDITGFFGGIGKWFSDRWHEVQVAFGDVSVWFAATWKKAWENVTSFFGGIGKWFGDRWHDIQNVFGGIGKWFSDRWTDVMNSTAPFRTYMGDVFQTIWNILVALWGKLGQWFNDRWTDVKKFLAPIGGWFHDKWQEAWNATTAVFGAIGKWFGDRWHDIQNVFGAIGKWFHDRWTEAWNAIVLVFTPVGKWFGDRWHDIQNIFVGVGNWFHDRFTEAWTKVTQLWQPIGKWFGDRWNDIMGGLNTFKTAVSNKWNEIKTDTSTIFKNMINGIIDLLNDGISAIESFINFFGQGLDNIAVSLGTKGTIPVAHLGRIAHYAAGTPEGGHPGGPMVVGEEGPELLFAPKGSTVVPADITEALLSMFKGKVPGYAGGVGDIASSIIGWVSGGAKSLLDNVVNALHITAPNLGPMSNISSGIFASLEKWALSWINGILPKFNASSSGIAVNVPGNVASWIQAAMSLTGVPSNWATDLGVIAMHESGGNPNAINRTDSNALAGHPSQGLFQTIPSTFAAHMLPGHTNILNPIDNAASAIEYILGRYGDVFHVPGIVSLSHGGAYQGYANGGIINEPISGIGLHTGTRYAFGEHGKELVTPYVPSGVNLAQQSQAPAPHSAQPGPGQPIILQIDGHTFARLTLPYTVSQIRNTVGVFGT